MYLKGFVLFGLLSCITKAENKINKYSSNPWFYQVENGKIDENEKYYIMPLSTGPEVISYPWETFDTEHNIRYNQQPRIRRASGWKGTWDISSDPNPLNPTSSVITYSTGANYKGNGGSFNSGIGVTPDVSNAIHLSGSKTVFDNSRHKLIASGSTDRVYTPNFHELGQYTTGNLEYRYVNGANAILSGTSQTGLPNTGYVSASLPIHQNKNGGVNVGARTDFGSGMKPVHQFGLFANYNF